MNILARLTNKILVLQKRKWENYLNATKTTQPLVDFKPSNRVIQDTLSLYAIKDEEIDEKITEAIKKWLVYAEYVVNEVDRMKKYDDTIPLIDYLRNCEKWSWRSIDQYLHYSEDYSRQKLGRYKKRYDNTDQKNV